VAHADRTAAAFAEVAPGIHRLESDLGPRFMAQYVLRGDERTLLVDTGLAGTPAEVIRPAIDPSAIDDVLISHADVDHCGGNRALRELNPRLRFACHELDRRWIESNRAMLAENYCWYEAYGFGLAEEAKAWIGRELGGDSAIDLGLRGGETLRLGEDWRVELLHLPGHTPGHLGIWDARSGTALIVDAVLERGIYDRAGTLMIPPRYYDAAAYVQTIRRIRELEPRLLLTAHYPVMEGAEVVAFLDRSLAFVAALEDVVRKGLAAGVTDLWELTQRADERVGPYVEGPVELAASVRAHMDALDLDGLTTASGK
jgi:glyoxylase-like metal-dependent hydrolase (beta-lactamase superfamily II)